MDDSDHTVTRTGWARLAMVAAFGIAFGYIEAAVVVYLRALFYPDGFTWPLADLSAIEGTMRFCLLTEVGREAATLVLLAAAAGLMAQTWRRRIGYFLLSFALWDVFYYVWLKVLLGWPESLADWDILFFIPNLWAGPVWAPLLTSGVMAWIAAGLFGARPLVMPPARILGLAACVVGIVVCFMLPGPHVTEPDYATHFPWAVFLVLHAAVVILMRRSWRR
ncbi:MAG TPA: hypothetical protein ENN87_10240 [Phycisphaerales bacterium]|nr:hypothetical protein [Phycisphaerales bacterium]